MRAWTVDADDIRVAEDLDEAADIQGFGGLMRAGADAPVRRRLEDAVRMSAKDAVCAEAGAGDAVLIVHEDPVALARSARHLVDEVYGAPGRPRLRVALHYGEVLTRRREGDGAIAVAGGEAVLCAVRIEPHVEPGQIWVTEEFSRQLARQPSLWRTSAVAVAGEERFAWNSERTQRKPRPPCCSRRSRGFAML